MNRVICRSFATATTASTAPKGRFQHWRKPVYHAPHINPLEVGADFTLNSSHIVQFTSKTQVENKLEQIRLAKQIVKALDEVRKAELVHASAAKQRSKLAKENELSKPLAKGKDLLS